MPTETASTTWSKSTPRRNAASQHRRGRPNGSPASANRRWMPCRLLAVGRRAVCWGRPEGHAPSSAAHSDRGHPRAGLDGPWLWRRRRAALVEMQRVEAVEELELDPAPMQRLVHGSDDYVAHPAVIFQKIAPLY